MSTYRVTYIDQSTEDVAGTGLRVYGDVLMVEDSDPRGHLYSRTWPLTDLAAWEAVQ